MKEILQKIGYKIQSSSWDRDDLSRMAITFASSELFNSIQLEYVINDQDVWQIILYKEKIEIVHAYKGNRSFGFIDFGNKTPSHESFKPIMEFERVFLGKVNGEEELIKILQQTDCPFIPTKREVV
jgi:hypothetical protein